MSELPPRPVAAIGPQLEPHRSAAKAALFGGLLIGLTVFLAVVIASIRRSPGVEGLLSGIFTGLFAGLLVAAAAAWAAIALMTPRSAKAQIDTQKGDDLEQLLAPTLDQLEATRAETLHQVNLRLVGRIPICVAIGIAGWIFSQFGRSPGTIFNLLEFAGFGAAVGWYWASHRLSERYRQLYKDRVLPQLAAQFGSLSYRPAVAPDMTLLRQQHIFREFDRVIAEDEIYGTYRGMALNIIELKLTYGSGKQRRVEFDGLLTQVELPRKLSGVTSVIADNGTLGNLEDRFLCEGREHVRVEDPGFEKIYEVYSTDQVGARALLTPAFMERFLALGARAGYMPPLALAQDNRLTIALPKADGRNLFEPPSYRQPAASRAALLALYGDIQAVLLAADAIIDLDQFSRAAQPSSPLA
jgi:hypothetical protein